MLPGDDSFIRHSVFSSLCPDRAMGYAPLLILFFAIHSLSIAQPAGQLEPVLAAADSAMNSARTVIYDAYVRGVPSSGRNYDIAGRVYLSRLPDTSKAGYKVRIELNNAIITYDGVRSLYVQPEKKLISQMDSVSTFAQYLDGMKLGDLVNMVFRRPPFMDMAPNARYEGLRSLHGIDCHVIRYQSPDNELVKDRISYYYISSTDHILRMRAATANYSGNSMWDTMTVSNLQLNVPIPDSMFTVETPAGFTLEILPPYRPQSLPDTGTAAPAWTLSDTAGTTVSLSDLKGRVVVLDFWYIGCPPCVRSMPRLAKLHERFSRQGVVFMGINTIDEPAKALAFIRRKELKYGFAFNGKNVADAYRVSAFPTMFVIGRDGMIKFIHEGDNEDLENILANAIEREIAGK